MRKRNSLKVNPTTSDCFETDDAIKKIIILCEKRYSCKFYSIILMCYLGNFPNCKNFLTIYSCFHLLSYSVNIRTNISDKWSNDLK